MKQCIEKPEQAILSLCRRNSYIKSKRRLRLRTVGLIQYGEETDAYLKSKNAEAITYNDKTILLKQNPGRASVFEELIHATQYRNGENDGSYVSRLNCEIKAQKKLLRNNKAYKLTETEVEQTKIALQQYESELKAYNEKGGD